MKHIALEYGLDEADIDVLLDERDATRYGIHTVPYFVINGRYAISGAQPTDVIKSVLVKIQSEERTKQPSEGAQCGPDGCHF